MQAIKIKEKILEILFPTPKICPLCGLKQDRLEICEDCLQLKRKISQEEGQCNRCGSFSQHGVYCPTCYGWPEGYIKNTAAFPYQDEFEQLVRNFKFNYHGYLANSAALAIFKELCRNKALIIDMAGALIIPVPMSPKRKRQKGYNQAEVLAIQLANIMETEISLRVLLRPKDTPHQVGLNRQERRKNLREAFMIPKDRVKDIEDRTIILVDDVITTSTTLQECAKILLNKGAKKVFSVTIAAGKNPQYPQPVDTEKKRPLKECAKDGSKELP